MRFVLVEFVKLLGHGQQEIKFFRRVPVKDPSLTCIRFKYPEEDDFKVVDDSQIVLVFTNEPMVKTANKRLAGIVLFEDERLAVFQPVY